MTLEQIETAAAVLNELAACTPNAENRMALDTACVLVHRQRRKLKGEAQHEQG
jgi:hypothetical protein